MSTLSQAEIDRYAQDGLVIPDFQISEEKLTRLRVAVEELVAANPDVPPEYLVGPHIPKQENPKLHMPFLDMCHDDEILDRVSDLIGPDIILWSSGVFCKPPEVGLTVPWHQDGQYWPIRPLATCSVWIALDDALPENGCMRYIPGSHRSKQLFPHKYTEDDALVLNQQLEIEPELLRTAQNDVLGAGQLSMHDVYLIHGSNANKSRRRRAGYVMRYMPSTSVYDRQLDMDQSSSIGVSDFQNRPIWLVRGKDRSGKNDFNMGHL